MPQRYVGRGYAAHNLISDDPAYYAARGYSPENVHRMVSAEVMTRAGGVELREVPEREGTVRAHLRKLRPVREHTRRFTGNIVTNIRKSTDPVFPHLYYIETVSRRTGAVKSLLAMNELDAASMVKRLRAGESARKVQGY